MHKSNITVIYTYTTGQKYHTILLQILDRKIGIFFNQFCCNNTKRFKIWTLSFRKSLPASVLVKGKLIFASTVRNYIAIFDGWYFSMKLKYFAACMNIYDNVIVAATATSSCRMALSAGPKTIIVVIINKNNK